jgi:hypothetical protein
VKPAALLLSMLVACGGAPPGPVSPAAAPASGGAAPVVIVASPDVDLRDAKGALVGSRRVEMDGVAEGLAWPSLRAAVNRKPGDHAPLTIAVARDVPFASVMRAVWTLRDADIRLQTPDAAGATHVLPLHPKPDPAGDGTSAAEPRSGLHQEGCHLAVFVGKAGDLRVAYPGGPRSFVGPDASSELARALAAAQLRCAIRYIAFGAESAELAWGSVFDVAAAVDRDKSAGDARYVLGEPVHVGAR